MSALQGGAVRDAEAGAEADQQGRPTLRIVSGHPSAEEIAALVAVLHAASGGSADAAAPVSSRSLWNDSTRAPGHRLAPGPGTWRASARTLR